MPSSSSFVTPVTPFTFDRIGVVKTILCFFSLYLERTKKNIFIHSLATDKHIHENEGTRTTYPPMNRRQRSDSAAPSPPSPRRQRSGVAAATPTGTLARQRHSRPSTEGPTASISTSPDAPPPPRPSVVGVVFGLAPACLHLLVLELRAWQRG